MINYALNWKKAVNFKQIELDEFIKKFPKLPTSIFLQKIDGILGAFVYEKGKESYFSTVNNIVIKDLPVIYEYESVLKDADIKEAVLIGELVAVKAGHILPFPQTASVVKTSYREDNKSLIQHYVYDVWSLGERKITNFHEAFLFLAKNFTRKNSIRVHMPRAAAGGIDALEKVFREWIGKPGVEGVVARLPDGKNYKIKPAMSVDLAIIGAGHERMPAWKKNQISYLITAFMDKDGVFRLSSKIGTGFSNMEREHLFEYVKTVSVQSYNGEFFFKPTKVAEVQFDRYRFKVMPAYKWDEFRYIKVGSLLSTTLDMPRFLRFREDKEVNEYDVRLTQIVDFPED